MTAATGNRNRSNSTVPSNRPITGTGGVARKIKPFTPQTNVVHNAAFYSNLLQTKTTQILDEMERLRDEIGDEDSRRALEKKLDDVRQQVRVLQTQLSDYSLAKENERSGTSHDDIRRQIHLLQARNKRLEIEVDEIFLTRKRTEDEISRLQLDRKKTNQEFAVQKLISEIENIREEERAEEEKMAHLSQRLGGIKSHRTKEEEERLNDLKRNIARIEEEIQLLGMDEAAARKYLLDKAQQEQELNDMSSKLENEMKDLVTEQRELRSRLRALNGGAEVLHFDKMKEIEAFLSNSSDEKAKLENYRLSLTAAIESLQDQISAAQKLSECPMPSKNEVQLMKEVSTIVYQTTNVFMVTIFHFDSHDDSTCCTTGGCFY